MSNIPRDHPRYRSLIARERLVEMKNLVAKEGLIAHGRGEAFDYLLGEQTCPPAMNAIKVAAQIIKTADNPVISVNGNVVALAAKEIADLSKTCNAKVEINLFHRTSERVSGLFEIMKGVGIETLGTNTDSVIPGLSSERAKCCSEGIGSADVVLVPLEDGDRCQALVDMGKTVIAIDLNPLSRTAQTAHITIVDELTRCLPLLTSCIGNSKEVNNYKETNNTCIASTYNTMVHYEEVCAYYTYNKVK